MSQLDDLFARCRAEGRAALIGYLPAGYPSVEESIEAAVALGLGGADVIEVGLPYSDPVMDGDVIQSATTQALAQGVSTDDAFRVVRAITEAADPEAAAQALSSRLRAAWKADPDMERYTFAAFSEPGPRR